MRFHTTQHIKVCGLWKRSMERPEGLGNKLKVFPKKGGKCIIKIKKKKHKVYNV